MNTTYPNKRSGRRITAGSRAPSQRVFPLSQFKIFDIGNGFWGFTVGKNIDLTRDIPTGFLVVGNVGVNPSVELFNAGTAFVLST